MPWWLRLLVEFLLGLIPSGISSYADEKKRQAAIADRGAAEQRQADDFADDEITAEARGERARTDALSEEESSNRFDRFRSRP